MAQTPEVRNLAGPPLERPMLVGGLLDSTWQRWFIDLWNRTGGASGDNIYTGLILGQIADIEKTLNSRLGEFENAISAAIAQFVLNNQQEVQDLISRITQVDQSVTIIGDETSASLIGLLQQAVSAAPVSSVFGRTGDIVAVEGDYDLTELGDVTLTAPASGEVLTYNGSAWANATATAIQSVTPSTNLFKIVDSDLVLPKATQKGIKVDTTTPTFPWADLLGPIEVRGTDANDPAFSIFRTNIRAYQFGVGDECWIPFHIPHDYVVGTDMFIHTHWAVTTNVVETVTWGFDLTYAKGYNQQAFPATVNVTVAQASSGTAYQHMIAEVQFTGGALLNLANIEVDGLILVRVYLSANTGAIDPFVFTADIHYQSTGIGTKQKNGPAFYT